MKLCVYGGHYGSEGKGSATEFLIPAARTVAIEQKPGEKYPSRTDKPTRRVIAFGENSPNSGHTCSLGKTRNLPAAAYFADDVIMGPDSVINPAILIDDLRNIKDVLGKVPRVFIHEHAAYACASDMQHEQQDGIVSSISSTGSGSGFARAVRKQYRRAPDATVGQRHTQEQMQDAGWRDVAVLDRESYMEMVRTCTYEDCIFECSQGTLLDVNWGMFPYVTSRTTLPRVAIERNGLGALLWNYAAVYRTYPIRTGGPSGPTGGEETSFEQIGVEQEIATVTKRIRRVFQFSQADYKLSLDLTRPNIVMFTHLDYIGVKPDDLPGFLRWYDSVCPGRVGYRVDALMLSDRTGQFVNHSTTDL